MDIEVNVDPVKMFPLLITVVAIFPAIIIVFSLSKAFLEILYIKAHDLKKKNLYSVLCKL